MNGVTSQGADEGTDGGCLESGDMSTHWTPKKEKERKKEDSIFLLTITTILSSPLMLIHSATQHGTSARRSGAKPLSHGT